MKPKLSSLFAGLVLIIVGILVLANDMSFLEGLSATTWMLIFAGSSALFLVAYIARGVHAWGWLFPVSIFAGLSGTMAISNSPGASQWIPTLIVGSVAVPFIAAFLLDRSRAWALFPTFVLVFVAFIPLMDSLFGENAIGAFVLAMIGMPFIIVHLISPKAWWGIIPGGLLLSISVMVALTNFNNDDISVAVMFIGWMLTFGYVWLRLAKAWAKYPATVFGILACLMALISLRLEAYWSIGLIVAGLVLIILNLRPSRTTVVK